MSVPQDFSNLEVILQRSDDALKEVQQTPEKWLVPFENFKQVAFSDAKEVAGHRATTSITSQQWGKSFNKPQLSVVSLPPTESSFNSPKDLLPQQNQHPKRICYLPAKGFWLLLGAILAIIALAVGIPLGLHSRKNGSSSGSSPASSSSVAPSSPSTSALPPPPTSVDLNNDSSGLASVAWNDSNGVAQYRVYFQDRQNAIKESAWNASAHIWQETRSLGVAKAKSPLSAAVTGPQDFSFVWYSLCCSRAIANTVIHRN